MTIDITTLFVCLDDFCKLYESSLKAKTLPTCKTRQRQGYLSLSEMLLIEILYHFSHYKNFKYFYIHDILAGIVTNSINSRAMTVLLLRKSDFLCR